MTFNLFEELGAVGTFTEPSSFPRASSSSKSETTETELPPRVRFGTPEETPQDNGDLPDLRLKAHRMRLPYHDERVNDPEIRKWMEDRRLGVGASEIAVLFGLSPWQTVRELWGEKVHGCSYEPGSELFHFGHEFEPLIAAEFSARTGESVDYPPEMIMIGTKPHYRASLDRVVVENGKPVAALELKNLNESRFAEYRVAGPSIGYLLQLQYQMMVAELDYGYLAVMFGGQKFAAWQVNANPAVQAEIARRVDEFWGYVERKEEPPETLGMRNISPDHEGHILDLDSPPWEERLTELEQLRLKKAKIDKEEKILKQALKEKLGSFQTAKAGRMMASVSVSTRRSVDMARLKEEHPELIDQYTKESEVKIMRVRRKR